ncbi:hypothetical protein D3C80_1734760 [compost metagenome]
MACASASLSLPDSGCFETVTPNVIGSTTPVKVSFAVQPFFPVVNTTDWILFLSAASSALSKSAFFHAASSIEK